MEFFNLELGNEMAGIVFELEQARGYSRRDARKLSKGGGGRDVTYVKKNGKEIHFSDGKRI